MEAVNINSLFFEKVRDNFQLCEEHQLKIMANALLSYLSEHSTAFSFHFHPLGFIYSKLHEFDNGETIRLHIWDKSRYHQQPLMHIHDHFYNVNSFVVCGYLHNIVYKTKLAVDANYSVYRGSYNNGNRVLRKTDEKLFVEQDYISIIQKNSIYDVPKLQFHSSYVNDDCLTCTIVYTEDNGAPTPIVVGPLDGDLEYFYENKKVDNETMLNVINSIKRQIFD